MAKLGRPLLRFAQMGAAVLAVVTCTIGASAQNCLMWRPLSTSPFSSQFFYDLNSRRVVCAQRGAAYNLKLTMMQWDGAAWTTITTANAPASRDYYGMVYDTVRNRLVLHGGYSKKSDGTDLYDGKTYEWDGTTWALRASNGPVRNSAALAFDAGRQRTVLYGGTDPAYVNQTDTWEWDGTSWERRATTGYVTDSPGRGVYDARRARIVVFGRWVSGVGSVPETWEWDGNSWQLLNPGVQKDAKSSGLIWDPAVQRVVRWGADAADQAYTRRWEWTGTTWVQSPFDGPPAFDYWNSVFDPLLEEFVLQGSGNSLIGLPYTWTGVEGNWHSRTVEGGPSAALHVYDPIRHEAVSIWNYDTAYYQNNRTILTADGAWNDVGKAPNWKRAGARMVFDESRGQVVSFGGWNIEPSHQTISYLADTILWDGQSWTTGGTGPTARASNGLAYDSMRGRTVLFGGVRTYQFSAPVYYADTWEWDGTLWTPVNASGPSARAGSAFGYDPLRGRVVLFGGSFSSTGSTSTYFGDTWEYDGVAWTQIATNGPSARSSGPMTFDASLGKLIMFGGTTGSATTANDTWTWDGTSWVQLNQLPSSPAYSQDGYTRVMFDADRQRTIMGMYDYELSRAHDIVRHPEARRVNAGHRAAFLVAAANAGAVTYRWRRDGSPLNDDGRISGATKPLLVISNVQPGDAGSYDVTVTSTCASATSQGAPLAVFCPADWNRDGFVNGEDFDLFVAEFEDGAPWADFDQNGYVNGIDFDQFADEFAAGC